MCDLFHYILILDKDVQKDELDVLNYLSVMIMVQNYFYLQVHQYK